MNPVPGQTRASTPIRLAAQNLLNMIRAEEELERMIPNDAAWEIIEKAERLAKEVLK